MIVDLHIHSSYSYDAENYSIDDICKSAIEKGVSTIAITDHFEFFRGKKADEEKFDIFSQQKDIENCCAKYGDKVEILKGIEFGQLFADVEYSQSIIKKYKFDFIIGSVHAMPCDTDIYFLNYDNLEDDEFLSQYFDEVDKLVDFGGFSALAHIDYPLRVMKKDDNYPTFKKHVDRVENVLKNIIKKDIALEINTKGLFGWQESVGPESFVLKRYKELGGKLLTLGSDSHSAPTVGRGIKEGIEHAKSAGFSEITLFRGQKPYQIGL